VPEYVKRKPWQSNQQNPAATNGTFVGQANIVFRQVTTVHRLSKRRMPLGVQFIPPPSTIVIFGKKVAYEPIPDTSYRDPFHSWLSRQAIPTDFTLRPKPVPVPEPEPTPNRPPFAAWFSSQAGRHELIPYKRVAYQDLPFDPQPKAITPWLPQTPPPSSSNTGATGTKVLLFPVVSTSFVMGLAPSWLGTQAPAPPPPPTLRIFAKRIEIEPVVDFEYPKKPLVPVPAQPVLKRYPPLPPDPDPAEYRHLQAAWYGVQAIYQPVVFAFRPPPLPEPLPPDYRDSFHSFVSPAALPPPVPPAKRVSYEPEPPTEYRPAFDAFLSRIQGAPPPISTFKPVYLPEPPTEYRPTFAAWVSDQIPPPPVDTTVVFAHRVDYEPEPPTEYRPAFEAYLSPQFPGFFTDPSSLRVVRLPFPEEEAFELPEMFLPWISFQVPPIPVPPPQPTHGPFRVKAAMSFC
jgi:hypothetical protein